MSLLMGIKSGKLENLFLNFSCQSLQLLILETAIKCGFKDIVTDQGVRTGEQIKTKEYSEATRYYTGKSSIPLFVGGFSINSSFKNFDLSALFNFSFGSYIYDSVYASLMNGFEEAGEQGHPDLEKRWQKPWRLNRCSAIFEWSK